MDDKSTELLADAVRARQDSRAGTSNARRQGQCGESHEAAARHDQSRDRKGAETAEIHATRTVIDSSTRNETRDRVDMVGDGDDSDVSGVARRPCHGRGTGWRRRSRLLHASSVVLIGLAVAIIGGRGIAQGGVGWSDGANHLLDGIFVYEFVRSWPVDRPMAWAEQFYLHYPSLGIVVYWPPGFAGIEAMVFAIFGVSLVAARLLVLAFTFSAGYVMFRLVRDLYGVGLGLIAGLLLVTCPFGERWMTDIMLEWPATFWILLAVWAYVRGSGSPACSCAFGSSSQTSGMDLDTPVMPPRKLHAWSLTCGLAIAVAFLTKQTAGFILPVILAHALLSKKGRQWLRHFATLTGFAICAACMVGYAIVSRSYAGLASKLLAWDFNGLWYARHGGEIFGWVILVGATLGVVAMCVRRLRAATQGLNPLWRVGRHRLPYGRGSEGVSRGVESLGMLFVFWFVAWYGFSSSIEAKEPRYLFFALPPVVLAAAVGIRSLGRLVGHGRLAVWLTGLLATLVIVGNTTIAVARSRGHLPSYAPAVDLLVERGDADLVLVDAVRDGQFVFDVYQNDASRGRIIPLRASKLLYARAARMKYGGELRVESETEIVELLNRLGIRYVVMESQAPHTRDATIDPRPRKLLRSLVEDASRFSLRGEWPLACDDPDWDDVSLCVYEYLECPMRTTTHVTIPVPAMGRDVEIELP